MRGEVRGPRAGGRGGEPFEPCASAPSASPKKSPPNLQSPFAGEQDGIPPGPRPSAPGPGGAAYAELHCLSNFTFLRGASHPEELVERAHALGYRALAITDECSLSGVVRAHQKARELGLPLIIGSEIRLNDGPRLVLLATNRTGYGQLCRLITRGRRHAGKGAYQLRWADLEGTLGDCLALLPLDLDEPDDAIAELCRTFAGRAWLAVELLRDGRDAERLRYSGHLARDYQLPRLASGDVHMHVRGRRALQDLLTAIRLNTPVAALGHARQPNGERHLRALDDLASLYPPEMLDETLRVVERCRFSLDELRYEYPNDVTPAGLTPRVYLRQLTEQGIRRRWPAGCPGQVRAQVEHELDLIAELDYEAYFLTVWDIVRYARERDILCQGRGSAANSAVCYCLGITEVDPARMNLLFERFISRERNEPPDIDVDFEHQRREEVIQYIYARYGRERAALAATVICYRTRSAVRDVGKALGLGLEQIEALVSAVSAWRRHGEISPGHLAEAGFDPDNPTLRRLRVLVNTLRGFPRHLSQHVGGFVIAAGRLDELVPIENAAMAERTVIQWEKDDLEALGLLKVDVLALGMLSAIRRAIDLINGFQGWRATGQGRGSMHQGRGPRAEGRGDKPLEPRASVLAPGGVTTKNTKDTKGDEAIAPVRNQKLFAPFAVDVPALRELHVRFLGPRPSALGPGASALGPGASALGPGASEPALRLGLRLVRGLSQSAAERIAVARRAGAFADVSDLTRRAHLDRGDLKALAAADALRGLAGHRHHAAWQVAGVEDAMPLYGLGRFNEQAPRLRAPSAGQAVLADYAQLGLSLRDHPLALVRGRLRERGFLSAGEVALRAPGEVVRAAGLVLIRQRPGNGRAIFVTLEDESGGLNLLIWADLAERQRRILLGAQLLGVVAEIQRAEGVQHLICRHLEDHSGLLGGLAVVSRDFH